MTPGWNSRLEAAARFLVTQLDLPAVVPKAREQLVAEALGWADALIAAELETRPCTHAKTEIAEREGVPVDVCVKCSKEVYE